MDHDIIVHTKRCFTKVEFTCLFLEWFSCSSRMFPQLAFDRQERQAAEQALEGLGPKTVQFLFCKGILWHPGKAKFQSLFYPEIYPVFLCPRVSALLLVCWQVWNAPLGLQLGARTLRAIGEWKSCGDSPCLKSSPSWIGRASPFCACGEYWILWQIQGMNKFDQICAKTCTRGWKWEKVRLWAWVHAIGTGALELGFWKETGGSNKKNGTAG